MRVRRHPEPVFQKPIESPAMSTKQISGTTPVGDRTQWQQLPGFPGDGVHGDRKRQVGEAERRRHERIAGLGLQVVMLGKRYGLADLSLGGFRVAGYDGTLKVGDPFEFGLRMMVNGCITSFQGRAVTYRRQGSVLIAVFTDDQPYFYRTLCLYIEQERAVRLSYRTDANRGVPKPAFVAQTV